MESWICNNSIMKAEMGWGVGSKVQPHIIPSKDSKTTNQFTIIHKSIYRRLLYDWITATAPHTLLSKFWIPSSPLAVQIFIMYLLLLFFLYLTSKRLISPSLRQLISHFFKKKFLHPLFNFYAPWFSTMVSTHTFHMFSYFAKLATLLIL